MATKPKQNAQQAAIENDQNAAPIGATSQSPIGSANPQQSQNSLNNSQQHQMVRPCASSANMHAFDECVSTPFRHGFDSDVLFISIFFGTMCVQQQQRENRPCQQQVQKIASESMIPTYRSGTDSMHKTNPSGPNPKQQQQQQQNNSSSFSANVPKVDGKNAVNNESNQNQCNSPVKRRSISQIDVRHFLSFSIPYSVIVFVYVCCVCVRFVSTCLLI